MRCTCATGLAASLRLADAALPSVRQHHKLYRAVPRSVVLIVSSHAPLVVVKIINEITKTKITNERKRCKKKKRNRVRTRNGHVGERDGVHALR